jgi:hypothetical protein
MNLQPLFTNGFWKPAEIAPLVLLLIGVALIFAIKLLPYLQRYYNQYVRVQQFRNLVGAMALERKDTNVLWELAQRYALNEPGQILCSLPLFDELAQKEMERVLRHPYPSTAKMRYIDLLYSLRNKMYFEG